MTLLSLLALIVSGYALLCAAVLAVECGAALLVPRRARMTLVRVPRTVVLVPAHDEEGCLAAALESEFIATFLARYGVAQ